MLHILGQQHPSPLRRDALLGKLLASKLILLLESLQRLRSSATAAAAAAATTGAPLPLMLSDGAVEPTLTPAAAFAAGKGQQRGPLHKIFAGCVMNLQATPEAPLLEGSDL